jgi:uncharacterized protein (TIGR03118 family)
MKTSGFISSTAAISTLVLFGASCGGGATPLDPSASVAEDIGTVENACGGSQPKNAFTVTPLLSDDPSVVPAKFKDPLLKNAWGLAAGPKTFWWVANNATGTATLYDDDGRKQPLEVKVPGDPTGLVFNGGDGFVVKSDYASGPAAFLFASEDGTISGWNPNVPPPPPSREAFVVVDNSSEDAVYKGLAIASTSYGDRLFATDFHNGKVDVFDERFALVSLACGAFEDPNLPKGFAPFGIRAIGDKIIVTYALQDDKAHDDVAALGNGFVDAYDEGGAFLFRIASRGRLDSPWGLVQAPDDFGPFGDALLVGNFGNGHINAFDLSKCGRHGCKKLGELLDDSGDPIVIDGLWSLDFGKGNELTGETNDLFFTAGPNGEANGLFGRIDPVKENEKGDE